MLTIFCNLRSPEKLTQKQSANLELIKRARRIEEPGGSRISEVIKVMLAGPVPIPNDRRTVPLAAADAS